MSFISIKRVRKDLDSRNISVVELVVEHLKLIKKLNSAINACVFTDETLAIFLAKKAQKIIDDGKASLLTGIPIGVKDNIRVKDLCLTCGSAVLAEIKAEKDAKVVENLKNEGAIFFSKLNMDEFAMGSTNTTSAFGGVKNPYDLSFVAGGSSGGSAAAVASGMFAASLGTDTGGSIRQPASFCGVVGFRPTFGRVSYKGAVPLSPMLDQIGPIAASAEDCEIIFKAMAKKSTVNCLRKKIKTLKGLKGIKIAIISELMASFVDKEVRDCVERAAKWFEENGAIVDFVSMPMIKFAPLVYKMICAKDVMHSFSVSDSAKKNFSKESNDKYTCSLGIEIKKRMLLGTYLHNLDACDYYKKAIKVLKLIKSEHEKVFSKYDMLLSPTSPTKALRFKDVNNTATIDNSFSDICTVGSSLAGVPSISTPCGYSKDGLPLGLMLSSKSMSDEFLLSVAKIYEKYFEKKIPKHTKRTQIIYANFSQ